jgi:UMF1 family MFS transporter
MANKRKEIFSWVLYDWANGAFSLTVMAGFFPVFFKDFWSAGVDPTVSTARLGLGNAIAGLMVALLSPLLGALADAGRAKKKLMGFFVLFGVASSGMLFFVGQGNWIFAIMVFIFASIGFNCANLFYDSLLIDICEKEKMDMVSSLGYSLGYLGCGLLFLFNVIMVSKPTLFGLDGPASAVKMSFLMAAVWWMVFSLPLFLFVKEKFYSEARGLLSIIQNSMKNLSTTFVKIINDRTLLVFLIAYWLYIDGLNTFVLMSVDFGLSIGISAKALMIALLVVQFVAFPSALVFGFMARRFGAFSMIVVGIFIYILVSGVGALMLRTQTDFIILAGITGMAQGGIQALSRSYFAKLVPPSESADYFGFYNVVSRFAVIIGPAVVGMVGLLTRNAGLSSNFASRVGMSSISVLFVGGVVMLIWAEFNKRKSLALVINPIGP